MLRRTLHRSRRHLAANLVGYVALFVALGGSAGAAAIITSNSQVGPAVIAGAKGPAGSTDNVIAASIGPADLASASVTAGKLANNAVTSAKIGDGQVANADLANGAVTSAKLGAGAVGPANIASGAVGADALAPDVQAPLNLSLTPTSANGAPEGSVAVGGLVFTVSCVQFPTGDPALLVTAVSRQDSELDLATFQQAAGGSVQPSLRSTPSQANSGMPVELVQDARAQATIVWHDTDETVTGTLSVLADATHCEAHGQLDRAVS